MLMTSSNRHCRILAILAFSGLLAAVPTQAGSDDRTEQAEVAGALQRTFPGITITSINSAPIAGLYEVMLGPEIVYVSADGRYLLQGDLLDLKERRNRSEDLRADARNETLKDIDLEDIIEFAPPSPRYTVYAFTDVSCGFCRRLHRDVPTLNKMGIAIRYLAFPRNGPDSQSFTEMESVWCAKDRKKAMTDAKNGIHVESMKCENPVAKQFELGRTIGVHGTPAIYATNGRSLPGYLPPDEFMETLQEITD